VILVLVSNPDAVNKSRALASFCLKKERSRPIGSAAFTKDRVRKSPAVRKWMPAHSFQREAPGFQLSSDWCVRSLPPWHS
jgi:hypothetical protein